MKGYKCQRGRLKEDFAALAKIGALEGGGVTRLAFSPEDMAAREWLHRAMEQAGLKVSYDAVGNMRGWRQGKRNLPAVMLGSHLDTVPEGGNFDGVVGVLAALEVVRVLNDGEILTDRPIEVVNFSAEESSRFGMATIGSKVLTGKLDEHELAGILDKDGIDLKKILENRDYPIDKESKSSLCRYDIHAFLELHIEQGPVLEQENCAVGIVTAIAAPSRFKVLIEGQADHSGNTPMGLRKDALTAAAELALGVERIAAEEAGKNTVATVGYLDVSPGVMNVVPGRVELGIDIRDICMDDKNRAVQAVKILMQQIEEKRGVQVEYEQLCDDTPVLLAGNIIATLEDVATQLNLSYRKMPSGAGHDAMNMAGVTDAGMIFIPSAGGKSHNIAEYSRLDDICAGTELLLETTLRLAREPS